MYAGVPLCLILYLIEKKLKRVPQTGDPANTPTFRNKLLFIIPAFFDITYVTLGLIGLTMTAAGVYQMLNGGIIFWSFVLSKLYLKRKFVWLHYVAILLLLSGLILVGVSSILWSKVPDLR